MGKSKIKTFYNTIKYLKPVQIYYRLYYFIRNRFFKKSYKKQLSDGYFNLDWNDFIVYSNTYLGNNSFTFLNLSKDFENNIDWNFEEYGKLWSFNLNYFDFLNQTNIYVEDALKLIKDYISNDEVLKDGKTSYPISLRGINWVKFLSKHTVLDKDIDQNLYNHYQILLFNPEYHLLGNHLLENGFAFLFGGYYFKDEILYKQAVKILKIELKEQVLKDGGHFELSPMYHQTMLFRVLDCIQLIKLNVWKNDDLLLFLESTALKMQSWLKEVTFDNGDIPMVNDSSYSIAPTTEDLLNYGKQLGLPINQVKLSDSGYRMIKNKKYELFIDVGNVGAKYQPAHVHSDTFNFVFYYRNTPIVVDRGVSTYEKNEIRNKERSTDSHNTVKIGEIEQTEVWGGFRVANRAKVIELIEEGNSIQARHDGYKKINLFHTRKFELEEDSIKIIDKISKNNNYSQIAHFHFHPQINKILIKGNHVELLNENIKFVFSGGLIKIEKENYDYACGFNQVLKAEKIKVYFKTNLISNIKI